MSSLPDVSLNATSWNLLADACADPTACVDLRSVDYVHPPGAVALVLTARARSASGLEPLVVHAPASLDVQTYLQRIDVVDKLESEGCDVSGFDGVRQHRRHSSSGFTQVLDAEQGLKTVLGVLWDFLQAHLAPAAVKHAYDPLVALVSNVDRHAATATLAAAHVQVYTNRIELAVGDLGPGFHASLTQNPRHVDLMDDVAALRASIHSAASRHQDPHHGGDVQRVVRSVRSLSGKIRIQSRDGLATASARSVDFAAATCFPGCLVGIQIPR